MHKEHFHIPWGLIKKFFKDIFDKKNKKMSGNLTVVGKDHIEIEIPHSYPKKVKVKFLDKPSSSPCNPGFEDTYAWSLKRGLCHNYILIIYWNVNSQREIGWEIKF